SDYRHGEVHCEVEVNTEDAHVHCHCAEIIYHHKLGEDCEVLLKLSFTSWMLEVGEVHEPSAPVDCRTVSDRDVVSAEGGVVIITVPGEVGGILSVTWAIVEIQRLIVAHI